MKTLSRRFTSKSFKNNVSKIKKIMRHFVDPLTCHVLFERPLTKNDEILMVRFGPAEVAWCSVFLPNVCYRDLVKCNLIWWFDFRLWLTFASSKNTLKADKGNPKIKISSYLPRFNLSR